MKKLLHRVWAEINLDALGQNIRNIKEYTGNKEIMAVVKANAYGHGVALVAPELYRLGITRFSVSNIGEARELRELLPEAEILVFGGCEAEWFGYITDLNLIQTVGDMEFAEELSCWAAQNNKTVRVHIKADTGMSRIGIETAEEAEKIMLQLLETTRSKDIREECDQLLFFIYTYIGEIDKAKAIAEQLNSICCCKDEMLESLYGEEGCAIKSTIFLWKSRSLQKSASLSLKPTSPFLRRCSKTPSASIPTICAGFICSLRNCSQNRPIPEKLCTISANPVNTP